MSLMDEVVSSVAKLDEATIRARLAEIEEQKAKRKVAQQTKLAELTPEQKAERNAKATEYRMKNADKFKESRKAYNQKPEVVERRKIYMKKRNAERTALIARAKEMGILS